MHLVGRVALDQPEVEERDLAAGPEQVVAGVRIAVERVQPVDAAEHEAEDRLGRGVALVLRPRLDLGEACAVGELGREHAAGRQLVDHVGNVDERMARRTSRRRGVGCRPRCRSRAPRRAASRSSSTSGPGSKPGNSSPSARNKTSVLTRSARIASSTPGYCTLTATVRPECVTARCTWPIDAAAIGVGIPLREHALGRVAELLAHDLRGQLGRHRRRVLLQRRERLAHRLRQAVVEVARHLAELHQRALQLAERVGDLGGGAQLVRGVELASRRSGDAVARRARWTAWRRRRCGRRSRRGGALRDATRVANEPGAAPARGRSRGGHDGHATAAPIARWTVVVAGPHVATVAAGQYT